MNFSVLMSVYKNDHPDFLETAIASITKDQTLLPSEIVIVQDGPISPELGSIIAKAIQKKYCPIKKIELPENRGLGPALQVGILACCNEIVFRMDADDISVENRFAIQIDSFESSSVDVIGSNVDEFVESPDRIVGLRKVPQTAIEIKEWSNWRNPINHPTAAMKRSKVLAVGGYTCMPYFEDYYLWLRMLKTKHKFYNIPRSLVKMRVGDAHVSRRHGLKYFRHEVRFFTAAMNNGLLKPTVVLSNILFRFPLRILPRNKLNFVYRELLRNTN